ncbi:MAG: hypothetical protein N2578_02215 [Bdellovibrionaceae bacterium]|nr:hypothetical protein [Pseudobdellovibrionaceae bacterium]
MRLFLILFLTGTLLGCRSMNDKSESSLTNAQLEQQLRWIASSDEDGDDERSDGASSTADDTAVLRVDRGEVWEHDPGPDVSTAVGKRYAEIFANTPNYRSIGKFLLAEGRNDNREKFRWQFGPMFYRGRLGQNQVKVLIIGQEGAQDENVSDRSFTGGTGGRMQNMLSYMGIDRSYLFINTFVYTITGQYADYAPMLVNGRAVYANLLTPNMLRLAQDPRSPIVQHRHQLLDHIIESNRDSMRLIIAVGGAAQDSLSTYIRSKGGECQPEVSDPAKVQLVRYKSAPAGGNKRFYFPVDENGNNILLNPGEKPNYEDPAFQEQLRSRLNKPGYFEKIVRRTDGPMKNGLYDLAQTTLRLETCTVGGKKNTLAGLKGITRDIRYIGVQHPGSNSPTLQAKFAAALATIKSWRSSGWDLPPDRSNDGRLLPQPFDVGFRYSHKAVPRRDFRFGLTDVIGLGKTNTTRRSSGTEIEFGSRDSGNYKDTPDAYTPEKSYMEEDLPNEPPKTRYSAFDFGPGEKWAKVFTEGLPVRELLAANKTAAPRFGAGVIYRGRPEGAEVLVLADQTSHDDLWVGRALMGLEGQRLQAFLRGIGAGLNYVIIRTLPVDTLGADSASVKRLLDISRKWRTGVINEIVKINSGSVKMILTLGPHADAEIKQINMGSLPIISLTQGYEKAYSEITKLTTWKKPNMRLETKPIPIAREDVPYGMRRWTGTSGDRVMRAVGSFDGKLYKIEAPDWATRGVYAQPRPLSATELGLLQKIRVEE